MRWYVAYSLSLRNLEEMIAERGFEVDHSTVHRWVITLVPLFEKTFRRHKRAVGRNWRMDETYIKVKGDWKYLYRAVDKARPSTFCREPTGTRLQRVATSRRPSAAMALPRRSRWTEAERIQPPFRPSTLNGRRLSRSGKTSILTTLSSRTTGPSNASSNR